MSANSSVVKRSLVAMTILALGLILSVGVVTLPPAAASEPEDSAGEIERGADFDFLDHELMYAGRLSPDVPAERGPDFYALDHELLYAGRYGPGTVARGADFDFLDHELMYAGGYALRPATAVARGADFDFLDHELMYAGCYAPCRCSQ